MPKNNYLSLGVVCIILLLVAAVKFSGVQPNTIESDVKSNIIKLGEKEIHCVNWVRSSADYHTSEKLNLNIYQMIGPGPYEETNFTQGYGSVGFGYIKCEDTDISKTETASQAEGYGNCWFLEHPYDSLTQNCGEVYYHTITNGDFNDVCLIIANKTIHSELRIGADQDYVSEGSCRWLSEEELRNRIALFHGFP